MSHPRKTQVQSKCCDLEKQVTEAIERHGARLRWESDSGEGLRVTRYGSLAGKALAGRHSGTCVAFLGARRASGKQRPLVASSRSTTAHKKYSMKEHIRRGLIVCAKLATREALVMPEQTCAPGKKLLSPPTASPRTFGHTPGKKIYTKKKRALKELPTTLAYL